MSRSRRHMPIYGHLCAESEKDDKRRANRHHRRINGMLLRVHGDETALRLLREVSSPYDMEKDGKRWFDPSTEPEGLRK